MTFDATIISPERFSTMKVESLTDGRWRSDAIRLGPFVGEWRSCGACSAEGSAKLACASGLSPPPASSRGRSALNVDLLWTGGIVLCIGHQF